MLDEDILVISESDIAAYGDDIDLYIIDEADQVIRSFAIAFDSSLRATGLHFLRYKNVIFTSATFASTEKSFLSEIMRLNLDADFVRY